MAHGRISRLWYLPPAELARLMQRIVWQRAYLARYVPHRAPPVQTYHAIWQRRRRRLMRGMK